MKKLLTILISRNQGTWWDMHVSEGDPPEERSFLYIYSQLMNVIRTKLQRVETTDETTKHP